MNQRTFLELTAEVYAGAGFYAVGVVIAVDSVMAIRPPADEGAELRGMRALVHLKTGLAYYVRETPAEVAGCIK